MLKKNTGSCGRLTIIALVVPLLIVSIVLMARAKEKSDESAFLLYIGSYSNSNGEGIYIGKINRETGALELVQSIQAVNPSFLILHPDKRHLYAVNETRDFEGQPGGAVSAYLIDEKNGGLKLINQQPTQGGSPCHLTLDKSGKYLAVANYSGGNVAVFPLLPDGSLGQATDMVQHTGSSINKHRQNAPHAHSVNFTPDGQFVYAADLGIDKIMIYKFTGINGKLLENPPPCFKTTAGAGPRHFTFHPNGQFAFIINELNNTVTSCAFDAQNGALTEIHSVSTLPQNFTGSSSCAEVQVSPDGRFVYGSNRGHDSIAIFAFDDKTGRLSLTGHESTQGKTPRNFIIDPTGAFLLAANQNSNDIVTFRINKTDGSLQFTGHSLQVHAPVCIKLLHLE